MRVEKTILDDHQARVVVEVEPPRVEAARRRAARKLAARGKVPGFRPGKAPYEVILRHYGDEAVQEQAMDLLVDEIYPEVLKEAEIEPAAAGKLEQVEGGAETRFTFTVPLSPQVTLGKYRDLRIPYEFEPPGAEKVEQALEELRQVYATTETVERATQPGDYLVLDMRSDVKSLERSDFALIVREADHADEFPFPGFSRRLIGLEAGASTTLEHKFATDVQDPALAGQSVRVDITIKAVRSMNLPPLDDAFSKMAGKFDTLDALKAALAKDIEARARADYDDEYYMKVVDRLRAESVIKYSPPTLEHEAEHVVQDMRSRLAQQGLDIETYYKMRQTDAARFLEEEAKPVAQKRLERSLVLDEVARQEKIEVDNDALDQEFSTTLMGLQSQGINLQAVRGGRQGQQRVAEALAMQSANRLLTRRTLERLRAIATGVFVPDAVAEAKSGSAEPGHEGNEHDESATTPPAQEPGRRKARKSKAGSAASAGAKSHSTT